MIVNIIISLFLANALIDAVLAKNIPWIVIYSILLIPYIYLVFHKEKNNNY